MKQLLLSADGLVLRIKNIKLFFLAVLSISLPEWQLQHFLNYQEFISCTEDLAN